MAQPKNGSLRVYWYPQVPCEPFFRDVSDVEEAISILNTLAEYDQFLLSHNHRVDYSNAGGILVFNSEDIVDDDPETGWTDWSDDHGNDIDEVMMQAEAP